MKHSLILIFLCTSGLHAFQCEQITDANLCLDNTVTGCTWTMTSSTIGCVPQGTPPTACYITLDPSAIGPGSGTFSSPWTVLSAANVLSCAISNVVTIYVININDGFALNLDDLINVENSALTIITFKY